MIKYSITFDLKDNRIIPFLLKNERASIYHHPAWLRAIAKTFNHKPFYFLAQDEFNNVVGLIPLIKIKSIITGNRIVCLPFSTYCDPLMPKNILKDAISNLFLSFDKNYMIELRTLIDYSEFLYGMSHISEFVTHILHLNRNIQSTFDSFHPTSVRASIRRAEKNNLTFKVDNSESGLKIFYDLETRLRKRLSLPPLPFLFYNNIFKELNNAGLISLPVVEKDNRPVAAGFILNFKDTYYLEYTASDKNYNGLYPNHKLFWEIIKIANENGALKVDFGRTKIDNMPLIIFKEKWNTEKINIHHFSYPNTGILKRNIALLKNILIKMNSVLPISILKLEGHLIYKHLD